MENENTLYLGIDTGGTFTDVCVSRDNSLIDYFKIASTPEKPSEAILKSLEIIFSICCTINLFYFYIIVFIF